MQYTPEAFEDLRRSADAVIAERDARIEALTLQLLETGGELGKCQENRNKNMETIRRYETRIAELEKALTRIANSGVDDSGREVETLGYGEIRSIALVALGITF